MSVEVVLATPGPQRLVRLELAGGATVAMAIEASGIPAEFPEFAGSTCRTAIWGQLVEPGQILKDGDRIEILRPLEIDPRTERRELASAGRFMGGGRGR